MKLPQPPKDLWSMMDSIRQSCGLTEPPEQCFRVSQYAEKYGLNRNTARCDVEAMLRSKKIKVWGQYKGVTYYEQA